MLKSPKRKLLLGFVLLVVTAYNLQVIVLFPISLLFGERWGVLFINLGSVLLFLAAFYFLIAGIVGIVREKRAGHKK